MPCWLITITASHVKVTVQLASQIGPNPIKVWRKHDIRCPVIGNPDGRWGKFKLPVPVDCFVCPIAVLTLTVGSKRFILTIGASAAK